MVHGARDIVGELAVLGTVEIGLYLSAGGHRRFSLEVEGIGRTPQLGTAADASGDCERSTGYARKRGEHA